VEFTVDLGSGLHWGTPTVPCFRPVTDASQLKIHIAEDQSHFVAEILQLFSLVSCVLRDVHKFDFRLIINKKLCHLVVETRGFDKICVFYPTIFVACVRGLYPGCGC
jgi:hypothetical protein